MNRHGRAIEAPPRFKPDLVISWTFKPDSLRFVE